MSRILIGIGAAIGSLGGLVALSFHVSAAATGVLFFLWGSVVTGLILDRIDRARRRGRHSEPPEGEAPSDLQSTEHWGFRGRPGS